MTHQIGTSTYTGDVNDEDDRGDEAGVDHDDDDGQCPPPSTIRLDVTLSLVYRPLSPECITSEPEPETQYYK